MANRNCGTCAFFQLPKAAPGGEHPAQDVNGVYVYGQCKWEPVVHRKSPEDWCGQHALGDPAPAIGETKENPDA